MQSIEILAVTMRAKNFDIVKKMNIQGAAIIANQDDRFEMSICPDNKQVIMYTTSDRGVGKNRNMALLNANADICVLADDDMTFDDNYESTVKEAFASIPQADIIIFNLDTVGEVTRDRRNNKRISKVHKYNVMNYGAGRVAFRRKSIIKANLFFSLLFGGGGKYSSGEDTIFLTAALKSRLEIYTYPKRIATVKQTESTWFQGYIDKYFMDKGALYKCISRKMFVFLCLQDAVRHSKIYDRNALESFRLMLIGGKEFSYK